MFVSDYCADFGATYTLSSSQLLQSLMGSCSINEGLDLDITPSPSPQPSAGGTIRAAAQLEPGLTSKPPLPPTPIPNSQSRTDTAMSDDLIALKFQRWFPDSILESEIVEKCTANINSFERQDEADLSDGGSESVELSDRESSGRISANASRLTKPKKTTNDKTKKNSVKFSEMKIDVKSKKVDNRSKINEVGTHNSKISNKEPLNPKLSPKIVIHEPSLYGCDVVTDEFASGSNIRCLTPDYVACLKPNRLSIKDANDKSLSLSDLNVSKSPCSEFDQKVVFSDSELYQVNQPTGQPTESATDNKQGEHCESRYLQPSSFVNDSPRPKTYDTSPSKFMYNLTEVENENTKPSVDSQSMEGEHQSVTNINKVVEQETFSSNGKEVKNLSKESNLHEQYKNVYHDHLTSYMSYKQNGTDDIKVIDINTGKTTDKSKTNWDSEKHASFSEIGSLKHGAHQEQYENIYHDHLTSYMSYKQNRNDENKILDIDTEKTTDKCKISSNSEKHASFPEKIGSLKHDSSSEVSSLKHVTSSEIGSVKHASSSGVEYVYDQLVEARRKNEKCSVKGAGSAKVRDKTLSKTEKDRNMFTKDNHEVCEGVSKKQTYDHCSGGKDISRAASVPPYPTPNPLVSLSKHNKNGMNGSKSKQRMKRSMSYDASSISVITSFIYFLLKVPSELCWSNVKMNHKIYNFEQ